MTRAIMTAGGYESTCRRRSLEDWIECVEWFARHRGYDVPADKYATVNDGIACADGIRQCMHCARRQVERATQAAIAAVPAGPCVYCGGPGETVDHVIPRARGGSDDPENLVRACKLCNCSKGNRTPDEWSAQIPPQKFWAK